MASISAFEYSGEGLRRVYENQAWMVGLKNYKPGNDAALFDEIERHLETDELFLLLAGTCRLLEAFEEEGALRFSATLMKPGVLYVIPQGHWHTTITEPGVKLALIEDPRTGSANSEVRKLDKAELAAVAQALAAAP